MPLTLYCVRHGETEWSLSGRHTGLTDIPLTDNGRRQAKRVAAGLKRARIALVLVSPLQRARETCALAGYDVGSVVTPDLLEWNYGQYEGLTTDQIQQRAPGWLLFRDGCPGGETADQVGARVDRVIERALEADGDVALFAHGHVLRTLAARWIGLPAEEGKRFLLGTATLCALGFYRDERAVTVWNAPLPDHD
jgi:probable phosphoglycerate mutase